MDASTIDFVKERANVLATTDSSKQETKDAANAWLAAVEADNSEAAVDKATEDLLAYLEGRPQSIDSAIAFADSDMAKDLIGEEHIPEYLAYCEAQKAQGNKYCICEACQAAGQILDKFGRA